MSEEEKQRRAAEHFSLFALDGKASGAILWQHVARVDREEVSATSTLRCFATADFRRYVWTCAHALTVGLCNAAKHVHRKA